MNAGKPTVCPKCNYARTAADAAPAWQCPSCGIAYIKFKNTAKPEAGEGTVPRVDARQRAASLGLRDKVSGTAILVYPLVLLLIYPLALARQTSLMILPPILMAACAFLLWLRAYRRLRVVADVPTSTIAAAAQGYTELHGQVAEAPGHALVGHLTRTPCVWYRYFWSRPGKNGKGDEGELGVPFILRDATGECLINTEHAEVICDRCETWSDGLSLTLFHEWSIRIGDPVYAIGYFSSDGAAVEAHVNLKVACALAAKERDAEAHVARYDANRDGKVDRQETSLAREALRRDTMQQYAAQGGAHALIRPPDGRPFLVIGADHARIVRRYRLLTLAHLCVFFISLGFAGYAWSI